MEEEIKEGYDPDTGEYFGEVEGFEAEDVGEELEDIYNMDLEDIRKYREELTEEEYLELIYQNYPSAWMEEHLVNPQQPDKPLELRDYQTTMINDRGKKKIARCGRQLGKSASIQMMILYYGLKRKNSKILVIGPQKTHVEEIFEACEELLSACPGLKQHVTSKKQPMQFVFKLPDGSRNRALFMTTGEESGGKGVSIRGKTANVLFVDEADYINDEVMEKVVIPTTNSYAKPFIWMSSTPTGRKGFFRNTWDSGFYHTFHYASTNSPAWNTEKEAEIKASCTKMAYIHEYLAEWGDQEEGLFSKVDMAACSELSKITVANDKVPEGIIRQYRLEDGDDVLDAAIKPTQRILGVDWNKAGNGTRIIWVDFDEQHNMWLRGKWNIDSAEFTQNKAMAKIVDLHEKYNFDHIMVDVGYGSTQIEDLHLYGLQHKETGLHKKVKAVRTDSQMEITDIATGEERKTYVKNFAVESLVRFMEQHRVRMPETENVGAGKTKSDATIFDEMVEYVIEKYTANGRPVYKGKAGDHDLDAYMFTLYGYLTEVIKTQKLWDKMPTAKGKLVSYDKILKSRADRLNKSGRSDLFEVRAGEKEVDPFDQSTPHQSNNFYTSNGLTKRSIRRTGTPSPSGRSRGGISRRLR